MRPDSHLEAPPRPLIPSRPRPHGMDFSTSSSLGRETGHPMAAPASLRVLATLMAVLGGLSPAASQAPTTALSTAWLPVVEALSSPLTPQREEPFMRRPFQLEQDGRWLGKGVAYGCFRRGQAPGGKGPSEEELLEDLLIIQRHWRLIRLYNADDQAASILDLIQRHKLGMKVMLGVWLAPETDADNRAANSTNVLRSLQLAQDYPAEVACICVGNETQVEWSGHRMDPAQVVRYLRLVRQHSRVPVTTADDFAYWVKEESRSLAAEMDFITTHAHPLWNGQNLNHAVAWLDSTLQQVQERHPGQDLVLGETGWATRHDATRLGPGEQGSLMQGEVSEAAQERFLDLFHNWSLATRMPSFWFEVFDEPWKGGGEATGPDEVEKHWGLFHENRQPKDSFARHVARIGPAWPSTNDSHPSTNINPDPEKP